MGAVHTTAPVAAARLISVRRSIPRPAGRSAPPTPGSFVIAYRLLASNR
jgi:hypothetical protein